MNNTFFMKEALKLAHRAAQKGDVPVGAVIVKDGKIIARGRNRRQEKENPILHAEIDAMLKASQKLKTKYLTECELYVTLEPCPMCAGAIINAKIKGVVFGAYDEKGGATGSVCNLFEMPFNHKPALKGGVLEKECAQILSDFFIEKR